MRLFFHKAQQVTNLITFHQMKMFQHQKISSHRIQTAFLSQGVVPKANYHNSPVLDVESDQGFPIPSSLLLISIGDMSSSGFHSEHEAALFTTSCKKKKTTHISAGNRALVLRANIQADNDSGPSLLLCTTRQCKEMNYTQVKCKYTKK